jgi:hypothetical protein
VFSVLAGLRICVYEHVTRLSPLASVQQHRHLPSLANLYVPLNIVFSIVRLDSVILSRAMLNLYHCQFSVESAMCYLRHSFAILSLWNLGSVSMHPMSDSCWTDIMLCYIFLCFFHVSSCCVLISHPPISRG